jgi:hypothetical protein
MSRGDAAAARAIAEAHVLSAGEALGGWLAALAAPHRAGAAPG